MDIYGVIITCLTAVGTATSTILCFIFPAASALITGITGAIVTCGATICEVLRKYNQKKAAKALEEAKK